MYKQLKIKSRKLYNIELMDYYIIFIEFLIYVLYWSTITVKRYYSLHGNVFDMGIFVQSLLLILHGSLSYRIYMLGFAPFRYILAPIEIYPEIPGLLVIQTLFLAMPVFFIYSIAKIELRERLPSLFIASSYLIFFSLGGINWFDMHGQAFFIFFFIAGYYFYLRKKYSYAFIFIFISGLVRFPFMIFPLLFSIVSLSEIIINKKKTSFKPDKAIKNFLYIILFLSFFTLIISYFLDYYVTHLAVPLSDSLHVSYDESIFNNITPKIFTIMIFLVPFLLLPLYKIKWGIMLLPFFLLMFYSNDIGYQVPYIIHDQYSSAIIPFLYLGTIEGMKGMHNNAPYSKNHNFLKLSFYIKNPKVRSALIILVIIILFATVYQPYGPLNSYSGINYNLNKETNVNITSFNALNEIISLIPNNEQYVIFQNNMPQVLLHDPDIPAVLSNFVFGFPYNLTYELPNGTWTNRIDYVIADSNSNTFYESGATPYNTTMYEVLQRLYSTGKYGIMAEEYGFILLKHNYTGPIIYYHPISEQFAPNDLFVLNSSYRLDNIITGTNPDGHRIWWGPYAFLAPGQYSVTFYLSTTNNSVANHLKIWIGDWPFATFREITLTGSSFPKNNTVYNITENFSIDNFYNQVQFAGLSAYWNGSLSIYGIQVKQIQNESYFGEDS